MGLRSPGKGFRSRETGGRTPGVGFRTGGMETRSGGRTETGVVAKGTPRDSIGFLITSKRYGLRAVGATAGGVTRAPSRRDSPLTCKSLLAYGGFVSDVYQALAAEARRAILDELHDRDGQTLFELCTRLTMKHGLEMSRQAISQHLDVLEAAGLVRTERDGRYKFHYLDTDPLRVILDRWDL